MECLLTQLRERKIKNFILSPCHPFLPQPSSQTHMEQKGLAGTRAAEGQAGVPMGPPEGLP